MSDRAKLELTLGGPAGGRRRADDEPFRILVIADFSGRGAVPERFDPGKVRFETIDAAMTALAPAARIELDSPVVVDETLDLRSVDDFHPDALARHLGAVRTLTDLRERLADPASHADAVARLTELTGTDSVGGSAEPTPAAGDAAAEAPEGEDDMFERLLGGSSSASSKTRAQDKVQSFINDIMGEPAPRAAAVTAEVGTAQATELTSATLRAVLRSPALRSLERAWRSLDWLIRRLDDVAEIHMLDLSKDALSRHFGDNAESLDRSAFHRLLCEPRDVDGWDIVIGDYSFALDADDLALLATIGAIAAKAGIPFLAHGDMSLCGCPSPDAIGEPGDWRIADDDLGELWNAVRAHPAAAAVVLAAPRMLMRQPYGAATDPIDAFDFEELAPRPDHESFFWGSPAFGCAVVLALARTERPDGAPELDDLPTVLYDDGTGQALMAPVEGLVSERAAHRMQESGLVAMIARRDSNTVRCPHLHTVAISPGDLLA